MKTEETTPNEIKLLFQQEAVPILVDATIPKGT